MKETQKTQIAVSVNGTGGNAAASFLVDKEEKGKQLKD